MSDRSLLGPANVSDDALAAMLAAHWQVARVDVVSSEAAVVDYDQESIITGGRWWVTGTALVDGEEREFRLFVKVTQSFSRSPLFAHVPPEFRDAAVATVPWEAESCVYRSDLVAHLPEGLTMPAALAVIDLDETSRALWLEAVEVDVDAVWDDAAHVEAARLLGRLSGSDAVAPYATLDPLPMTIADYVGGRLEAAVLPVLRDEGVWSHPLVAAAYDERLRARLLAAADRVWDYVQDYLALPHVTAHGDATPHNLLRVAGRAGFTLIDFGFWRPQPAGYDLGQLLLGEVQVGVRGTDGLAELDAALTTAYCDGLAAEGSAHAVDDVRRGHALAMLFFHALPSLPVEDLHAPLTDALVARARARATAADHVLDLVEETDG